MRTGNPQNEIKHTGKSLFEALYADEAGFEQFMNAMAALSAGPFLVRLLRERDPLGRGGATGQLSIVVANRHPNIRCTTFDLPVVEPIAKRTGC